MKNTTEATMASTTNLMPDLAPWDYELLKSSIARVGVLLPVLKDEYGNTIDGYQRERACRELAITDYRIETVAGLSEDEKLDRAFTLNLVRRRLDQKQMRELIAAELKRTPDLSDNWLAQILGSTDKTVEAVRQNLIATYRAADEWPCPSAGGESQGDTDWSGVPHCRAGQGTPRGHLRAAGVGARQYLLLGDAAWRISAVMNMHRTPRRRFGVL